MNERTGRIGQTKIYVEKFARIFFNEKDWKTLVFAVVISGILAAVFGDKLFQIKETTRIAFFAIVSACTWIGIFNSIQLICRERQIIKREHRTGLHITSYVAAHLICQAVLCVIQAILMVLIYSIFTEFPKEGLISGSFHVDLGITFFLVLYSADVLGLAISSIVKTTTAAMTVMPFLLIIMLVFSGSIFPLSGVAKQISNLTITKWGQRVLCIEANLNELPSELLDSQKEMLNEIEVVQEAKELLPDKVVKSFDDALDEQLQSFLHKYTYRKIYDYKGELVWKRWGYLALFAAFYALICVVSLEFIDRDKR